MAVEEGLFYTKEHEWIKKEDDLIIVGITDFAQGELGELVYVEVDTLDEHVDRDEVFGTVEAVKTTSDLFMPVSGTIVAFNPELNEDEEDNPGAINEDPYGKGWIVKIKPSNQEEMADLMDYAAYQELIS